VSKEQPWTIKRLLEWTTTFLSQKGSESARLDTEVLLAHTLGCQRIELYTRWDEVASEEDRQTFRGLVRQRVEGCPVAYLVGRKEFFSLEFEVSPAVLIPRPDTEHVVVECLRLARKHQTPTVLDMGTGSGCLAVAVARQHPGAQVSAIDISPEALAVAAGNASKQGVGDRIRFLEGDLFSPLAPGERFDFILSNPPYIPHDDLNQLPSGVRDYEPHLALDGGADGFAVFDRLVAMSPDYLQPGGQLLLEIGSAQEIPARERLEALGYEVAPTLRDGAGYPRVLRAWLP
jgi:release factor glutamine methyltransferase